MSPERVETEVDGRQLSLSNLEKVLYPEVGFTKGQVLDYYARIADVMLGYLAQRPITLKRYPNGVDAASFFEKHAPSHTPEWVGRVEVPLRSEPVEFVLVSDRPALLWAANLATLEFHVPLWHVSKSEVLPTDPDYMVFDLDPGPGTTIVECCRVAQWITERLGTQQVFAKTSGSKGLQLYRPLNGVTSQQAGEEAHELAQTIERDHPDAVVSLMRKELRKGKVLIDWSQNNPSKTTVAAYSLRARSTPTVSTPVTWDEVGHCAQHGDPEDLRFVADDVLRRVETHGDLMEPLVTSMGRARQARSK